MEIEIEQLIKSKSAPQNWLLEIAANRQCHPHEPINELIKWNLLRKKIIGAHESPWMKIRLKAFHMHWSGVLLPILSCSPIGALIDELKTKDDYIRNRLKHLPSSWNFMGAFGMQETPFVNRLWTVDSMNHSTRRNMERKKILERLA